MPNVGKSTLFNALSSAKALAANYPFATKEPNVGIITVPDSRLDALSELVKPQRVVPTTVEVVDIAGLIKGASKGEGLGNQFLANIREVDAIVHVVRCFEDDNVIHVDGSIDPVRDKEIIDAELIFKDLETLEKRLEKQRKAAKGGHKELQKTVENLLLLQAHLESGKTARSFDYDACLEEDRREMLLLTDKPILYACNVDELSVIDGNDHTTRFVDSIQDENAEVLFVSAGIEAEIADLKAEERLEFLEEMGLKEPGVNRLILASYKLLKLITYFTAGEKEVRAWTVAEGTMAPQAAGGNSYRFRKRLHSRRSDTLRRLYNLWFRTVRQRSGKNGCSRQRISC